MFLSLNDIVLHVNENKKRICDGHISLVLPTWPFLWVKGKQVIQKRVLCLYDFELYRTCKSYFMDKMTKISFTRYEKRHKQIIRTCTYGCSKANNISTQKWTFHMRYGVFYNLLHKSHFGDMPKKLLHVFWIRYH